MLLPFFSEATTFLILDFLYDHSKIYDHRFKLIDRKYGVGDLKIRSFLLLSESEMEYFITLFHQEMGRLGHKEIGSLLTILKRKGIDVFDLTKKLFESFFGHCFPYDVKLICFFEYLNEGLEVLFRMGYAFFKFYKKTLINSRTKSELYKKIEQKSKSLTSIDKAHILTVNRP